VILFQQSLPYFFPRVFRKEDLAMSERVLLDIRSNTARAVAGCVPGSHAFPVDSLLTMAFALPPRSRPVTIVFDEQESLDAARAILQRLGYSRISDQRFDDCERRQVCPEAKLAATRCWEPSPFLEHVIPRVEAAVSGRVAVDVGCGCGRDMVFLGMRGWAAVGFDNRPKLLRQCALLAGRHGCASSVAGISSNVKVSLPFRPRSADLVVAVRFLHRPTLPKLLDLVAAGGYLVYSHFLDGCQHTPVGTPSTEQGYFLVGELEQRCRQAGLEIVSSQTAALEDGRPVVNVLCFRPVPRGCSNSAVL
jgi:hypothetical protein